MKRKTVRVLQTFFLIVLLLFTTAGASLFSGSITAEAATASLNKKSVRLDYGKKTTLLVRNARQAITWETSNENVVDIVSYKGSLDQTVTIKAVGGGSAKITALAGKKKLTCKVTVKGPKLSKTKATVKAGKKITLTVKNPTKKVTWSTSNKKVAKIKSKSGSKKQKAVIQCVGEGTVTITAKMGSVKLRAKIIVPHVHRFSAATCQTPATCSCGATQGGLAPHQPLSAADCTHNSACKVCGKVLQTALGHRDASGHVITENSATCTKSASCAFCGVKFAAKGHSWDTLTNTCTRCGADDLRQFIRFTIPNLATQGHIQLEYLKGGGARIMIGNSLESYYKDAILHTGGQTYKVDFCTFTGSLFGTYAVSGTSTGAMLPIANGNLRGRMIFGRPFGTFNVDSTTSVLEFDLWFYSGEKRTKYHIIVDGKETDGSKYTFSIVGTN